MILLYMKYSAQYHVFPATFHVISRKIEYLWDSVEEEEEEGTGPPPASGHTEPSFLLQQTGCNSTVIQYTQSEDELDQVGLTQAFIHHLKGQCHKIFGIFFILGIEPMWAPDKQAKMVLLKSLFSRRYSRKIRLHTVLACAEQESPFPFNLESI